MRPSKPLQLGGAVVRRSIMVARTATIPMLPALPTLLASIRKGCLAGPILRNQHGKPRTESRLTHAIARQRLKLVAKHLHHCGGSFATELRMAGLTDTKTAGIPGWGLRKSPQSAASMLTRPQRSFR